MYDCCRLKRHTDVSVYAICLTPLILYRIMYTEGALQTTTENRFACKVWTWNRKWELQQCTVDPAYMSLAGYHLLSLLRVQQTPSVPTESVWTESSRLCQNQVNTGTYNKKIFFWTLVIKKLKRRKVEAEALLKCPQTRVCSSVRSAVVLVQTDTRKDKFSCCNYYHTVAQSEDLLVCSCWRRCSGCWGWRTPNSALKGCCSGCPDSQDSHCLLPRGCTVLPTHTHIQHTC